MCCATDAVESQPIDLMAILEPLRKELAGLGIDFDTICRCAGDKSGSGKAKVKFVCVAPNLQESMAEMGESARDQVVMVRVDEETAKTLAAWVETGAVKSRSEAAALFIREGLKVRASELDTLNEALSDVRAARDRLRRQAREAFGMEEDGASPEPTVDN